MTERQGGDSATPVIPGEPRLPGPGRESPAAAAPTPFRKDPRNWGSQAAPQLEPLEATGLECLGVPENWVSIGLPRAPPAPTQSFSSRFPGATSLPHTCCPRPHLCPPGSSCWGARGKAPDSGPLLLAPALPRPVPRPLGRPRRRTRPRLSEPLPSPPPPPGLISHSGAGTPTPPGRRRHHRVAMETLCPPPPAHSHTLAGAQPLRTGRLLA